MNQFKPKNKTQLRLGIQDNQAHLIRARYRHRRGILLWLDNNCHGRAVCLSTSVCYFEHERIVTNNHVRYFKNGRACTLWTTENKVHSYGIPTLYNFILSFVSYEIFGSVESYTSLTCQYFIGGKVP